MTTARRYLALRNVLLLGTSVVSAFSLTELFAAGEQGAWYDPSDFSTMFQDAAGTTPVTAVEQPVGKILDKSGRGNHASQSTDASRPVLSARVNQLTYSEQFDNAAWDKDGLNTSGTPAWVNVAIAPDGTQTASKLLTTTANANHRIYQSTSLTIGVVSTLSVYAKAAEYRYLGLLNAFPDGVAVFDLQTGVVSSTDANVIATTITPDGDDGWYHCTMTSATTAYQTKQIAVFNDGTQSGGVFTGVANSGLYIWGADLRVTNVGVGLPAYQRVAAATDYATSGFPKYLKFDGTDDSLATGTINPGAVDKAQVFVGLRQIENGNYNGIVGLGATAFDAGSFLLWIRSSAGGGVIDSYARGSTSGTTGDVTSNAALSPPTTLTLSTLYDIAQSAVADEIRLRKNGAAEASTGGSSAGTGNFASGAVTVGQYNGASRFNGRLYSLILRFSAANLSDAQIASTETWVNGKTGAY